MHVNRKGIVVGQHFSLETALNTNEKGSVIPKLFQDEKSEEVCNILCLQVFNLASKIGGLRSATDSSVAAARQDNGCIVLNKIRFSLVELNPEFSS